MAAYLTATLAVIAALGAPRALAQGLNDPTRPPREMLGGAADAYEPAASSSPAQVVIISKDRRQATINGRTVNLGGRYGDATVVRITDEEIVLQKPEATETIRLYSSIQRKKHWPAARPEVEAAGRQEEETHDAN
jgi:MSHA biogenesis protein MshK